MNLEKYLYRLLFDCDRIVVPNFGTFVAKQKITSFTENYSQIKPERKLVSFSSDFDEDDFLVTKISEIERISLQEAINFVEKEVAKWTLDLQSNNEIRLDKIGTIFRNQEDKLYFVANEEENYSFGSFGLSPVDYLINQKIPKKPSLAIRLLKYFLIFCTILGINLVTVNQYLIQTKETSLKQWVECLWQNEPRFNFYSCNPFLIPNKTETTTDSLKTNQPILEFLEKDSLDFERDSANTTVDNLFEEIDSLTN